LALSHAQASDGPLGVRLVMADAAEGRVRLLAQRPAIDEAPPARAGAEEHLLGHAQRLDQVRLLEDDRHAPARRFGLGSRRVRLARQPHRARVGRREAGEDAREGALAGSVLAHEGMDLTREQLDRNVHEGRRRVGLGQTFGLEQRRRRHRAQRRVSAVTRSTGVSRSGCGDFFWSISSAYSMPNTASWSACWSAVASTWPPFTSSATAEMLSKPTMRTAASFPAAFRAATAPSAMLSL